MGHTAPPIRWYHVLLIVGLAALYSGGSIGAFMGGLVAFFIMVMIIRTFGHAAYSKLVNTEG